MLRFPAMKGRTSVTVALTLLLSLTTGRPLPGADAVPSPATAAAAADPISQITARHQKRDGLFSRMVLSPFTATASYHVDPGAAVRAGAGEGGVEMDPNAPMPYMATLTAGTNGLWVGPVAASPPPRIRESSGDGEPIPGEG